MDHDGDPQHGLLNVLLAVHSAAHDGTPAAVEALLSQRHPRLLAEAVASLEPEDVRRLRGLLTAYGCCEVTDPVGELRDLDLLDLDHVHPEETPS